MINEIKIDQLSNEAVFVTSLLNDSIMQDAERMTVNDISIAIARFYAVPETDSLEEVELSPHQSAAHAVFTAATTGRFDQAIGEIIEAN